MPVQTDPGLRKSPSAVVTAHCDMATQHPNHACLPPIRGDEQGQCGAEGTIVTAWVVSLFHLP